MLMSPTMMLDLAHDRQRELIGEADRARLLTRARRDRAGRGRTGSGVRGQPTGTLASCEPSAAAPAR